MTIPGARERDILFIRARHAVNPNANQKKKETTNKRTKEKVLVMAGGWVVPSFKEPPLFSLARQGPTQTPGR
jgi:hypothetical protein